MQTAKIYQFSQSKSVGVLSSLFTLNSLPPACVIDQLDKTKLIQALQKPENQILFGTYVTKLESLSEEIKQISERFESDLLKMQQESA